MTTEHEALIDINLALEIGLVVHQRADATGRVLVALSDIREAINRQATDRAWKRLALAAAKPRARNQTE